MMYMGDMKSKVGLAQAAAKNVTAAMRINLNIDGCGVVAPPVHSSCAPLSSSPTSLLSPRRSIV
jgi:hypothetical protein